MKYMTIIDRFTLGQALLSLVETLSILSQRSVYTSNNQLVCPDCPYFRWRFSTTRAIVLNGEMKPDKCLAIAQKPWMGCLWVTACIYMYRAAGSLSEWKFDSLLSESCPHIPPCPPPPLCSVQRSVSYRE